jgi:hypothetical protein
MVCLASTMEEGKQSNACDVHLLLLDINNKLLNKPVSSLLIFNIKLPAVLESAR